MNMQEQEDDLIRGLLLTEDPDAVRRKIAEKRAPAWINMTFEVKDLLLFFFR